MTKHPSLSLIHIFAPQLNTLLTDVEDLPRINELAQALQELKASGQLTKFKAVVSATQCESLDDVFDRIEKLPQYCFETKICDKDALVRDELEFVLGGRDADLIYKHLNREAYAEDVLKQYGAEITPYGMVLSLIHIFISYWLTGNVSSTPRSSVALLLIR